MNDLIEIYLNSFRTFIQYTWNEIIGNVSPWYVNYFWMLVFLSLFVWGVEVVFPWRKKQAIFRKDFWLDAFYIFFNFYLFKIIIFFAFSNVVEAWFTNSVGSLDKFILFDTKKLGLGMQLLVFFTALDFIQWFTHLMLHRIKFLWRFHKVHHSVEQLGFAAHFRFHWMENVIYTPMKFIGMMLIGNFDPEQAYIVYYISIAIGHLNHANIDLSYGPLKYILNNPRMHIWHHAYALPEGRKHGSNYGISLSLWDYIFGTAHIPGNGRDIKLGFKAVEDFPKGLVGQLLYNILPRKKKSN